MFTTEGVLQLIGIITIAEVIGAGLVAFIATRRPVYKKLLKWAMSQAEDLMETLQAEYEKVEKEA